MLTFYLLMLTTLSPPLPKFGLEAPASGCEEGERLTSGLALKAESQRSLVLWEGLRRSLQLPLSREPTNLFLGSYS